MCMAFALGIILKKDSAERDKKNQKRQMPYFRVTWGDVLMAKLLRIRPFRDLPLRWADYKIPLKQSEG